MGKAMRPTFTQVVERHRKIAVVGTGMSLQGIELNFADDVKVIAVNGAINHLKRVDYWFTLNPSKSNNEIMLPRNRKPEVKYYAAVPDNYMMAEEHVHYIHRLVGTGHGHLKTRCGMCADKGAIHTGNSAWGAFQLGAHMEPAYMALFGIDGQGGYHYGGSPKDLSMLPELFGSSIPDLTYRSINVVNGSPTSIVTCFPRMTPLGTVNWLNTRMVGHG